MNEADLRATAQRTHDERCCMTGNPPGLGPHPDCPGYPYWPDEERGAAMSTDAVTAFLADVRMQAEDHHLVPAAMVLPLVAFAEAALELAGDWDAESDHLDGLAGRPGADEEGAPIMAGRAIGLHDCAEALREAITAALTGPQPGEGTGDGH